jgi:hypothetical protein
MQTRTIETSPQAILTTKGVTVAYRHPTPRAPESAWACAGADPDLFFPEDDATLARARQVCAGCPLRDACRSLAIARGETGVWGGTLLIEGRMLDRVPVMGRPRKASAA